MTDLLPDHALLVTKTGQVEGRELYEIIRDTPRVKGTALELSKFVGDLIAANPAILETSQVLAPPDSSQRRPAVVIVQDDLAPGADAAALRAQGQVVAIMTMSGRGGDAERPFTGNWMNNTRAWLVGRNLPATHAAEVNAVVARLVQRSDVDPARISVRATGLAGIPVTACRRDQSADFLGGVDAHSSQRAGGDRPPDPHQPPRRGHARVRGEVGPGRSPRSAAAASGRVA